MANTGLPPDKEKERFLLANAEMAISSGRQLLAWWKERQQAPDVQRYELTPRGTAIKVSYFWDDFKLDDKPTSLMGCVWTSRFKRRDATAPPSAATLESFVKQHFLSVCRNVHSDGSERGFGFKARLYKLKGSDQRGMFPDEQAVALAEIGEKYDWVVFQCDVYNFFGSIPGTGKLPKGFTRFFPKVAAYDLIHEEYFSSVFPRAEGTVSECCFGYSFLPCEVYKSYFGYGPGRLGAAFKQFRFALLESGDLEIQLIFLSSPRSQKVLYLRGFDPVYSTIRLINLLTLGLFSLDRWAHNKLDAVMLGHHARVYQNLIDGMRGIWETHNWDISSRSQDQRAGFAGKL